jgi:hypothetical protein
MTYIISSSNSIKKAHYVHNSAQTSYACLWYDWDGYSISNLYENSFDQVYADPGFSAIGSSNANNSAYTLTVKPGKKLRIKGKMKIFYNSGQDLKLRFIPWWKSGGSNSYWSGNYSQISAMTEYVDFSTTQGKSSVHADANFAEIDVYMETHPSSSYLLGLQPTYRQGSWSYASFPKGSQVIEFTVEELP